MTGYTFIPLVIPYGFEDDEIVLSMSGGKDSTAAALYLIESGIKFRSVFADTGWEADETYEYLELLRRRLGIPIDVVKAEGGGMVDKIIARAGFPARKQRWCTRELKVEPLRAYHDAVIAAKGCDTISVVGIRAEESGERAKLPLFGYDNDWEGYVWRPLIDAPIEAVLELHHRHDIPVNPLYLKGFGRVDCNPCIYATKEEIQLTAEHHPQRIVQIDGLEKKCEDIRRERNAVEPGRYAHADATFFQARVVDHYEERREWVIDGRFKVPKGRKCPDGGPPPEGETRPGHWRILKHPHFKPMHIQDVVDWSRTMHGGKHLPVVREKPVGGCFRWGSCSPPAKTDTFEDALTSDDFIPEEDPGE